MEWKHGQKVQLARAAGISKQYLNGILSGRKCSRELARRLEKASASLGIPISRFDWMEADVTENKLFKNRR